MKRFGDGWSIRGLGLCVAGAAIVAFISPALARRSEGSNARVRSAAHGTPRIQLADMDEMGKMGGGKGEMGGMGGKPPPDGGGHAASPDGPGPDASPGIDDSRMQEHMKEMHRGMEKMRPPGDGGGGGTQGGSGGSPGSDGDM